MKRKTGYILSIIVISVVVYLTFSNKVYATIISDHITQGEIYLSDNSESIDMDETVLKVEETNEFVYRICQNSSRAKYVEITQYKGNETNVEIPTTIQGLSVTSIGYQTFLGCSEIVSIDIPEGITEIQPYAFNGCSGLISVTIPKSVEDIGIGAFASCSGLKEIIVTKGNRIYESIGNYNAIIAIATNRLISGCQSTVIPNTVFYIEQHAFVGCDGLKEITIPSSVKGIGYGAFARCKNLKDIYYEGSKTKWREITSNVDYVLEPGNEPTVHYMISESQTDTTPEPRNTKFITEKKDVIYVVTSSSQNNPTAEYIGLTKKGKKKKIISIPEYVSYNGVKYRVTSVSAKCFKNNKKLTNIKIASSITKIGNSAFEGCTNLKTATIGKGLKTIGKNAFKNCKSLKKLTLKGTKLKSVGKTALKGVNAKCKIKVPAKKVKAYKKVFKDKGQKASVKITK